MLRLRCVLHKPLFTHLVRQFCNQAPVMKWLNVAEKNDVAKSIANFLSGGQARRREGFSPYNKIYEFNATVFNQPVTMITTSVSGHLLNYEFTENYRGWQRCNPVELFDAPIVDVCEKDGEKIKRTLEREIRNCGGLIIWTDCDREGENIGFEIIKVCTSAKANIQIYRAKFSEITSASIKRALQNLERPNKNISDAVDVRRELDLRTGAAFTRLQTLRFQRLFPQKLSEKLISYGSCQFPTLGFVVDRFKEIEDFIPEQFWKIKLVHTKNDLSVDFNWKRERLFSKPECEILLEICQDNSTATVESVESKPKNKWRPLPLDTVELEKNVSKKLKINAKETMRIAERLYTQGYISYPRTETNIFPKELNLTNLVTVQTADYRWGEFATKILNDWGGPTPRQGRKSDQAHPPIHPIKHAPDLNGNEQRIYEYIVRHFLACCSKDALGHETTVSVDIANEKFTAKGLWILERNYLEVYPYEKWNAKEIHEYRRGETFVPTILDLHEGSTTAPNLLTEADLIYLMEKYGIGTDATHAEHIDTIKTREYVGLNEGLYFIPGTLGMGLVEGYDSINIGMSLAKPNLRAEFENDLKLICDGLKDPELVRREQIQKYRTAFETIVQQMAVIDEKLASRIGEHPNSNGPPPPRTNGPRGNNGNGGPGPGGGPGGGGGGGPRGFGSSNLFGQRRANNDDDDDDRGNPRSGPPNRFGNTLPLNQSTSNSRNAWFSNSSSNASTLNSIGSDETIVCNCGNPAILLTVRKEGVNKGRKFYKCDGGSCNFFLWATEDSTAINTTLNTSNFNRPSSSNSTGYVHNARGRGRGGKKFGGSNAKKKFVKPKETGGAKKRRCGVCGQEGHNRLNCPNT